MDLLLTVIENHFYTLLLLVHKLFKDPRIKLFEKINKPVLSHITFYQEDHDHKPIDSNGETISFTKYKFDKFHKVN